MAQFETIADGPLDSAGFLHAGGVSISVGKVGDQVLVESSLSDITNQGGVFVLQQSQQSLSSSLFALKPEGSVLEGQLFNDVEVLDHLKENCHEEVGK